MSTYLLTWNPENYAWDELDERIREVRERGSADDWWSCGGTKQIEPGSRFFLSRLGREPRGLVGTGTITSAPRATAHWDEKKRARGETTLRVEIRFDSLWRVPVIRRVELNAPELRDQQWDPQASGITIKQPIAERVEAVWRDRIGSADPTAYHLPHGALARWRERLAAFRANRELIEQHRVRDARREEVLPEIAALIAEFLTGRVSLAELRETFDRRTRNDWDVFGLKGLSGGMFLNKLAKHVPDQDAATRALQAVLAVPGDDATAARRMDDFQRFLAGLVDRGEVSTAELQPRRMPFLVSGCWHMQDRVRWPVFYESMRKAYASDGLFLSGAVGGDGYVEFAALTRALAAGLEVDPWTVEHVCVEMVEGGVAEAASGGDDDEAGESEDGSPRVWLYAPGRKASKWDEFFERGIAAIGWPKLGDLSKYRSLAELTETIRAMRDMENAPVNDALACWEFVNEMQPGDVIFAKRGRRHIIGYGIVTSPYRYDPSQPNYPNVRDVAWKKRGEWVPREKPLVMKTLTNIGAYAGLVAQIRGTLQLGVEPDDDGTDQGHDADGGEDEEITVVRVPYTLVDALQDLFVDEAWLARAMQLLRYKRNLVLQGPPGVGKTFVAQRLAYLLLGEKDKQRISKVQFHASYSYEDFIQGYRPQRGGGFERVDGPFFELCDAALQDPAQPYVFLIDEINRGNLSKIFGELLMLLEADKRTKDWAVRLTYAREGDVPFFVPPNVYVIGTMNTADRSLAMVDYALRRRFAFVDVPPAFASEDASERFEAHLAELGADETLRELLVQRVAQLNRQIVADKNLGPGFAIGHSYFCRVGEGGTADMAWFRRIIDTEIEPLLREYWFDNPEQAQKAADELRED